MPVTTTAVNALGQAGRGVGSLAALLGRGAAVLCLQIVAERAVDREVLDDQRVLDRRQQLQLVEDLCSIQRCIAHPRSLLPVGGTCWRAVLAGPARGLFTPVPVRAMVGRLRPWSIATSVAPACGSARSASAP